MNSTQADILIAVSHRLLIICGMILMVLLFGSPIRRKVDVEVTGDTGNIKQGTESDVQSKQPPTPKIELLSRTS